MAHVYECVVRETGNHFLQVADHLTGLDPAKRNDVPIEGDEEVSREILLAQRGEVW
jgi:hypothetical protein